MKLTLGTFGKGKKARTQELDAQSDILVEPKQKFPSRAERPNHEGWGPTRKRPTAAAEPSLTVCVTVGYRSEMWPFRLSSGREGGDGRFAGCKTANYTARFQALKVPGKSNAWSCAGPTPKSTSSSNTMNKCAGAVLNAAPSAGSTIINPSAVCVIVLHNSTCQAVPQRLPRARAAGGATALGLQPLHGAI